MNDNEMVQEVTQTFKKLDDVSAAAFLITMRALSLGATMKQAVEVGNKVLVKAGRKPVPPELFERPG